MAAEERVACCVKCDVNCQRWTPFRQVVLKDSVSVETGRVERNSGARLHVLRDNN